MKNIATVRVGDVLENTLLGLPDLSIGAGRIIICRIPSSLSTRIDGELPDACNSFLEDLETIEKFCNDYAKRNLPELPEQVPRDIPLFDLKSLRWYFSSGNQHLIRVPLPLGPTTSNNWGFTPQVRGLEITLANSDRIIGEPVTVPILQEERLSLMTV